jgi:membrane protein implicated in regulation of membrane protease activity/DNA-binding XRE family transcriptional regulator
MSFGDRLHALRRGIGITQEEFAQQLQVTRQAVSKWESSRGYPEIEKILYICQRYGVTMDELFQDELPSRPTQPEQSATASTEEQALSSPPLKKAVSDFLSNLSPQNQTLLWSVLSIVLVTLFILFFFFIPKGGSGQVYPKLIWLALLILFGVGEAATVGLTSIWFAVGSFAALIAALLGGEVWLQIVLFLAVSGLSLAAARPLVKKFLTPLHQPTNADRVIGAEAVVTEEINNLLSRGAVSVSGLTWSARSTHDTVIPVGTVVRVDRIEGVKLYVYESKEEVTC